MGIDESPLGPRYGVRFVAHRLPAVSGSHGSRFMVHGSRLTSYCLVLALCHGLQSMVDGYARLSREKQRLLATELP